MKILATVDGSGEAKAVIPMLTRLANAVGAEVTLLTVITESPQGVPRKGPAVEMVTPGGQMGAATVQTMRAEAILHPPPPAWDESKDQAVERLEAEARDFLEDFASPLRQAGIAVREVTLVDNDAAKAIVRYAREGGFDLVAMATHGRSGLREIVQGSVAAAVVRSGVAPVLLVRPKA
ncbi:MAG TPA: universal stress protein [Dehalococcoidia bacterium]|nr:universal stress protein [Dehalococcoidia bacterium]